MATENLKKPRSTEEARAWGQSGGKASGESRRRKRDMRERLQALLDSHVDGVKGADALALALFEKALSGDVKAIETMLRLVGQGEGQNIALPNFPVDGDLDAQAQAILKASVEGNLTSQAATTLMSLLGTMARIKEVAELRAQVEGIKRVIQRREN